MWYDAQMSAGGHRGSVPLRTSKRQRKACLQDQGHEPPILSSSRSANPAALQFPRHAAQACSRAQEKPSGRAADVFSKTLVVWDQSVPRGTDAALGGTASVLGQCVACVYVQVWAK